MVKICSRCKEEKPFEFFGKHSKNKDGYQYYCKACRIKTCSDSFSKTSQEQRNKRNEATKAWRKQNKEKLKEYRNKYTKSNRAKLTSLERKRQTAKLNRTPKWLSDFDYLHMQCLYQVAAMRTKETGYKWNVDHIIPLQGKKVSGLHCPSNLRVIPAIENQRKNNIYDV
jgi:hypothetical protein